MAFAGDVVLFADKFVVVKNVELLSRGQLFSTDHTCEAVEVEHLVPGLPHQVLWRDALGAPIALCSVSPVQANVKITILLSKQNILAY